MPENTPKTPGNEGTPGTPGNESTPSGIDLKSFITDVKPTWCPGCGNHGIWQAVRRSLAQMVNDGLPWEQIYWVWGIGCHGNGADFLKVPGFHGLHGRALPVATGARLANHDLTVVVEMGDGDGYGIGGNHFIHTCRRNINLTMIGHNNQVYGLTTGQTSPTSDKGFASPSTPSGVIEEPVNPCALALVSGATFVARGYPGDLKGLVELIIAGIRHPGVAVIDVMQPCVTFNKVNTFEWFNQRTYRLDESGWKTDDRIAAIAKAKEIDAEEKVALGVLFREEKPTYEDQLPQLAAGPLAKRDISHIDVGPLLEKLT